MYETYANRPNFGIEFAVEEKPEQLEKLRVHRKEDDVEIIDVDDGVESLAAYAVDHDFLAKHKGDKAMGDEEDEPGDGSPLQERDRRPVYNESLALPWSSFGRVYHEEPLVAVLMSAWVERRDEMHARTHIADGPANQCLCGALMRWSKILEVLIMEQT